MVLTKVEVGKTYPGFKQGLPERVQFDFGKSGGQLIFAYDSPTKQEINQVRNGNVKLGLSNVGGILFLLAKFGSENWIDLPYHYAFSEPYDMSELTDPSKGYSLTVVVFDNRTGIVKAIRLIAMPYQMSLLFNKLVGIQKEFVASGFKVDTAAYDANLVSVYSSYSTDELVKLGQTFDLEDDKKRNGGL